MCGIAGAIWLQDGAPLSQDVLRQMAKVIEHRGPDGEGFHYEQNPSGGVALAHRRLSIIDLVGGKQPMCNEDETIWITFNGEIYNYRELRSELQKQGHRFRTDSDTETIVHLYEERGMDFLAELRGMFAFALWDRPRGRLILARDRLGQKPLIYRRENNRLLFASEIKSILQVPGVPREVNPHALSEYLTYLYVPQPRTMFAGIEKLPPAHYAVYENGALEIERYWNLDLNRKIARPLEDVGEELNAQLDDAVRLRLRSDVPLGAFLSGGIDSTVIVGLMQRHAAQATKTYTIGFPISEFDETADAKLIAEHLKTDHHTFVVNPDSLAVLPTLTWHYDEPFGDSSMLPTYYVSEVTRRHVKVALTGDGGDELFGGYTRYQTVHKVGRIDNFPPVVRRLIGNGLWDFMPAPNKQDAFLRKLRDRMRLLRKEPPERFVRWVTQCTAATREALFTPEFAARLGNDDAEHVFVDAMHNCQERSAGSRAMLTDLQTYLPDDLLVKVDIASMANALECRSPFLDHHVVELATALPYTQKVSGTTSKYILKEMYRQMIPPSIAARRKMGFSIPLDHWFRNELRDFLYTHLTDPVCLDRGYFKPEAIHRLLSEHESGAWDHSRSLWSLLCLELWHRMFIDPSEAPSSAPEVPSIKLSAV
jgi:asparagine synthase (glutamine-hydrolysing)